MIKIAPQLYIGTTAEIPAIRKEIVHEDKTVTIQQDPTFKIVNLAHTFHYALHKWDRRGTDHSQDKCYVVHEDPLLLSVNWVDAADARYFDYKGEGAKNFHKIFNFIDKFRGPFKILIACNKGESRAPSVAMTYLAKRTDIMSEPQVNLADLKDGESVNDAIARAKLFDKPPYGLAREKFLRIFPEYYPGQGITEFLIDHWAEL